MDFVVPSFGEPREALARTVDACLAQENIQAGVWVVDDGSAIPVDRAALPADDRISLIRLDRNQGISAARMTAISHSKADFVACINVDVVLASEWAQRCIGYLEDHPTVGSVFGHMEPQRNTVLSRWRMRFHEQKFDRPIGPAPFAPGHATMFRAEAMRAVGGYDTRLKRVGEDSDISERLRVAGWDTHYLPAARCISTQIDSLAHLAQKDAVRGGYDVVTGLPGWRDVFSASRRLLNRLARNTVKRRFIFLPIDVAVFFLTLRFLWLERRRHPQVS